MKLYRYIGGFGVFALIAEAIVCIFITILTVRIIFHVVSVLNSGISQLLHKLLYYLFTKYIKGKLNE